MPEVIGHSRAVNAPAVTLGVALEQAAQALAPNSSTPRLDAEALLMYVCGVARAALIVHAQEPVDVQQYEQFRRLVARRQIGEPIAYLTGTCEFWSLPIGVTPAVLIPRPETELLVENALAHIPRDTEWTVADLGTGSGAIALAIARERPRCRIVATDISTATLDVARDNAHKLGIGNVEFRLGDWLAPLGDKQFDIVVSNPPYVRADDPHLREGDVRFEPKTALVGGSDGLDAIRRIAADARSRLRPGGSLLLEHGHDQADAVAGILANAGFGDIACCRDLAGQPRMTKAR